MWAFALIYPRQRWDQRQHSAPLARALLAESFAALKIIYTKTLQLFALLRAPGLRLEHSRTDGRLTGNPPSQSRENLQASEASQALGRRHFETSLQEVSQPSLSCPTF